METQHLQPISATRPLANRLRGVPAWALVTQLFISLGWLRAAAEKIIDPGWWQGSVIVEFLASQNDHTLPWYQPFAEFIVEPLSAQVAVVVVVAQLFAGVSLLTGRQVGPALVVGMLLNLNFMAAGAVNPSAFYLLSQGAVALWLVERGAWTATKRRAVQVAIAAATGLGIASVPFISTVSPDAVIDDPAAMFILGGLLCVAGLAIAEWRQTMRHAATATAGSGR